MDSSTSEYFQDYSPIVYNPPMANLELDRIKPKSITLKSIHYSATDTDPTHNLPTAFPELINTFAYQRLAQLPSPMSDLTPDTYFHPLYADGQAGIDQDFWGMAIEGDTPTIHYQRGLRNAVMDTEHQLQLLIGYILDTPRESLSDEKQQAIGNSLYYAKQHSHRFPEKLIAFQQNHRRIIDPQTIAPTIEENEEIIQGKKIFSYLPLIKYVPPTRLRRAYVKEVLTPLFDEDHYLQSSLLTWAQERTDHEAFHLGTIKLGSPEISQTEWTNILRSLLPYDTQICSQEKLILTPRSKNNQPVRLNHVFHEELADKINDRNLGQRFTRQAKINGLQEDWARAFTRAMGGEGIYLDAGLSYMADFTTYFAGGEPEIARITNRLQTEGVEHTAEIYQQELKTKLSL